MAQNELEIVIPCEDEIDALDALFYIETARAALAKGYKRIEGSWILESNTMMNRIIERLGGRRYKTYRIFEKSLEQ